MGNPRGFIEVSRIEAGYRPIEERVADFNEDGDPLSDCNWASSSGFKYGALNWIDSRLQPS